MKRFILTEEDKNDVMKNYFGEFDQKFYDFLIQMEIKESAKK